MKSAHLCNAEHSHSEILSKKHLAGSRWIGAAIAANIRLDNGIFKRQVGFTTPVVE